MKTLRKPGLRLKLGTLEGLLEKISKLPDDAPVRAVYVADRDDVRHEIIDHLERALAHVYAGRIWLAREELFEERR